ncbi:hypothetical protein ADICYQ_0159 [Cyclobacterium qasimii M12-11B]|uniref:Uncharacterized protein n=1 Tax=Cyclobacterium qasimii M12-11B TaxID=641524 RepID=S7X6M1_9BACT|nr:hypothetical protein ADICYQ_0159 [Cyclobacterium qasimii M12-11B]
MLFFIKNSNKGMVSTLIKDFKLRNELNCEIRRSVGFFSF